MSWTKTFFGTRHEIISKINKEQFETDAHPIASVRQFIAGQLPTLEQEPLEKMQYNVTASGGVSESDGHRSNNIFVSVSRDKIKPEPAPNPPLKDEDDGA